MRCYFHLVSDSETLRDEEGMEVVDLDAAYKEAREATRAMQKRDDPSETNRRGWSLAVTNEDGTVLFSFPLDGS